MSQASKTFMDSLKVAYEPDWPDAETTYQRVEACYGRAGPFLVTPRSR